MQTHTWDDGLHIVRLLEIVIVAAPPLLREDRLLLFDQEQDDDGWIIAIICSTLAIDTFSGLQATHSARL